MNETNQTVVWQTRVGFALLICAFVLLCVTQPLWLVGMGVLMSAAALLIGLGVPGPWLQHLTMAGRILAILGICVGLMGLASELVDFAMGLDVIFGVAAPPAILPLFIAAAGFVSARIGASLKQEQP